MIKHVTGKTYVVCPFEHSENAAPSSTAILHNGKRGILVCLHARCRERAQRDFIEALGPAGRAVMEGTRKSEGLKRLHAQLDEQEKGAQQPCSLDEVDTKIDGTIEVWKPGNVVVVRVPPGAGKTRAAEIALVKRGKGIIAAPTHKLCNEIEQALRKLGAEKVQRRQGITHAKLPDGTPACKFNDEAERIQKVGGSVAVLMCRQCPVQKTCTARRPLGEPGGQVVLVPQLLPGLDESEEILGRRRDAYPPGRARGLAGAPGERGEAPGAERHHPHDRRRLRVRAVHLDRHAAAGMGGQAGLGVGRPGVHPQPRGQGEARWPPRAGFQITAATWPAARSAGFVDLVMKFSSKDGTEGLRAAQLGGHGIVEAPESTRTQILRALNLLKPLRVVAEEVAQRGAGALRWRGDRLVVRVWTPEAEAIAKHGAVLLDATADVDALRVLCKNIEVVDLAVQDGAPISRTVVYRSGTAKRQLLKLKAPTWDKVTPAVVEALDRARAADVKKLLLVTYKRIADVLDSFDSPVADLVKQWEAEGRKLDVAHYGGLRGLNRWLDFDGLATIGDPWPPIREYIERAAELGVAPDLYLRHHAAAELAQAHGRLRNPSRKTPAHHFHIGTVAPLGWTSSTCTVVTVPLGRPETAKTVATGDLAKLVDTVGGVVKAAKIIGCTRQTLHRYLRGDRAAPTEVIEKLAGSADVTETPFIEAINSVGTFGYIPNPLPLSTISATDIPATVELSATASSITTYSMSTELAPAPAGATGALLVQHPPYEDLDADLPEEAR